jgi:hypothetical protein
MSFFSMACKKAKSRAWGTALVISSEACLVLVGFGDESVRWKLQAEI